MWQGRDYGIAGSAARVMFEEVVKQQAMAVDKVISRVMGRKVIDAVVRGASEVSIQALTLPAIDLILRVSNPALHPPNSVLYLNSISPSSSRLSLTALVQHKKHNYCIEVDRNGASARNKE